MSRDDARNQSFAACGAAIVAFIGVCHAFVGSALFPWGPALLGGAIGWYGLGLAVFVAGSLQLAGTVHLIEFPVVPFAAVEVLSGLAFTAIAAFAHHQFHLFAVAGALAGAATGFFHRRQAAV